MRQTALLDHQDREDDRREPSRPEPAEEGHGRPACAGSDHRDRNREHADDRQAQDDVQGDRPRHVSERRPEQHGAEHDERHRAEHLSDLLDEMGDLASAAPPEGAEHEAPDERRDET